MPIVRVIAPSELRLRWRSLLVLGLLTVVWAGVTMSAIAGARRTGSVLPRFQRATHAADANFGIVGDRDGSDLLRALLAHPDVIAADRVWSAGTNLAYDDRGVFVNLAGATRGVWGRDIDVPIPLSGRLADPTNPDEVTVTTGTAELLGIRPGDRLQIPTWDEAKWVEWLPDRGAYPPFDGPRVDVAVVGVVRMPHDLELNAESALFVYPTPAFVDKWNGAIANNDVNVVTSLRNPDRVANAIADELTTSLGRPVWVSSAAETYGLQFRSTANALRVGLLVLAIAAGLTGAFLVAVGVVREVRLAVNRYQPLSALGATASQRAIAVSAPIAVVAVVASALSVVVAVGVSARFPVGLARRAEPRQGVWLDLPVVICGACIVIVVVLVTAVVTAARRTGWKAVRRRPARRVTSFVGRLGPAVMVGHMNSLASRERRPALAAAIVTIAGLAGTAWFATSLSALGDDERRWGYTWSSSPELEFSSEQYPAAIATTLADPDVAGIARLNFENAFIDGRSVTVSTFEPEGGEPIAPRVLDGRLPLFFHEIALGRQTATSLGVSVGDSVQVGSSAAGPSQWTVVGLVVPPNLLGTTHPAIGAFTDLDNHIRLFEGVPVTSYLAIAYEDGVDRHVVEQRLAADPGWFFGARSHPRQPGAVASLTGVLVLLPWLGGFFLVLGLGATILAAMRRGTSSERDVQILRAIGFTPGDIRRSLLGEATLIGIFGTCLGVPLGLTLGREAWTLATDDLGVVATSASPLVVILGTLAVAVLGTVFVTIAGAPHLLASAARSARRDT